MSSLVIFVSKYIYIFSVSFYSFLKKVKNRIDKGMENEREKTSTFTPDIYSLNNQSKFR